MNPTVITVHENPLFHNLPDHAEELAERSVFDILMEAVIKMTFCYYGWPDKGDFSDEETLTLRCVDTPYLREALESLGCEVEWYDDDPCIEPYWAVRHSTCNKELHQFFVKLWKLKPHEREID